MVAFLFCFVLFSFLFCGHSVSAKKPMAHVFCFEKKNNENLQQAGNCTHFCVGRIWDSFFVFSFYLVHQMQSTQSWIDQSIFHLILIENQNRQKNVNKTVYFYQRSHFLNKLIFMISAFICFVHPIFSSFGFWYFGHFSSFFFSRLAHLALQNVNKDYVIVLYFRNFITKSDQKRKMGWTKQ